MADAKTMAMCYFYGTIKGIIEGFIGSFLPGMPADLVIAIGAYWASGKWRNYSWLLDGLAYGAATSLGLSGGIALPVAAHAQTTAKVRW